MDPRDRDEGHWDEMHDRDDYFPCGADYANELKKHYYDEALSEKLGLIPTGLDGRFIDLRKDGGRMTMLDLGSGYGDFGAYLASYVKTYIGVDVSKVITDKGNKAVREVGITNMYFLQARDGSLDCLRDEDFDLVFSTGVFIHIAQYQVQAYLRDLPRILKPDGRFLLHFNMGVNGANLHDDRCVQMYSEEELAAVFDGSGLKILDEWNQPPFSFNRFVKYVFGEKE